MEEYWLNHLLHIVLFRGSYGKSFFEVDHVGKGLGSYGDSFSRGLYGEKAVLSIGEEMCFPFIAIAVVRHLRNIKKSVALQVSVLQYLHYDRHIPNFNFNVWISTITSYQCLLEVVSGYYKLLKFYCYHLVFSLFGVVTKIYSLIHFLTA